jgi:hypothetical protein
VGSEMCIRDSFIMIEAMMNFKGYSNEL